MAFCIFRFLRERPFLGFLMGTNRRTSICQPVGQSGKDVRFFGCVMLHRDKATPRVMARECLKMGLQFPVEADSRACRIKQIK